MWIQKDPGLAQISKCLPAWVTGMDNALEMIK
jgi:hypothetical protein